MAVTQSRGNAVYINVRTKPRRTTIHFKCGQNLSARPRNECIWSLYKYT